MMCRHRGVARTSLVLVLALGGGALFTGSGCASATRRAPDASRLERATVPVTLRDRLAASDLEVGNSSQRSIADAIRHHRPHFLRTRGAGGPGVRVYLDGVALGGPEQLEHIQVSAVAAVVRLSGREATTRFGVGHGDGAILVTTRPRSPAPADDHYGATRR